MSHQHQSGVTRGFTRVELLSCLLIVLVIVVLILVMIAGFHGGSRGIKSLLNGSQMREAHKAMLLFNENAGRGATDALPRPSSIATLGSGSAADHSLDTTAALYSALVAQNYLTPKIVVSAIERNPLVKIKSDFDYEAYAPDKGSYWDPTFVADLSQLSNVSFAHLPMVRTRSDALWRDSGDAHLPILSNRGPLNGACHESSYCCSGDAWSGSIVFADNSVKALDTMMPKVWRDEPGGPPDNIFRDDSGKRTAARDIYLAFTKSVLQDGTIEFQHD